MSKNLKKFHCSTAARYFCMCKTRTCLFYLMIILCLVTRVAHAQQPMAKTKNASTTMSDQFISGSWTGKGVDIINLGFKDSINEGYWYNIDFKMFPESKGRVKLDGSVSVVQKSDPSKIVMTRKLKGEGIREENFIKLNYQYISEPADPTSGFGMMLYKFSLADNSATGFYVSKSFITGELVNGKFNLTKSH